MTLLLDTHVWIWSQEEPERIGPKTRELLHEVRNVRLLSAISTLEIARLIHLRTLEFTQPLEDWITESAKALSASQLDVTHETAREAYALPGDLHKDPADRILVASARLLSATLVTADTRLLAYRHVDSIAATD